VPLTGESTGPEEDSTGASAEREREGGFDPQPQPKAWRLAQGEYSKGASKGSATGTLARHGNTAQPRGGPGGC
jgi:hypothetical protein